MPGFFFLSVPPVQRVAERQVPKDQEAIFVAGHDLLDSGSDARGGQEGIVNPPPTQPEPSHPFKKKGDGIR